MESTETSSDLNASLEVENSMAVSPNMESTDSTPILENDDAAAPPVDNESAVAESPAAKERSPKQKEADEGAAEILKRMRALYNTEFANIPANKRPKPPAWAARAALYKNGEEREEYIQSMIRNTKNSLAAKSAPVANNAFANNTGNSDALMSQLITALETATRVAKQLKHSTRKGKRSSAMNVVAPNFTANSAMNESMNSAPENASMNSNMNVNNNVPNTSFAKSKRVSPLMRKTKKASKRNSLYNEPPMTF